MAYIKKAIVIKQQNKWNIYVYRVYDSRCSFYLFKDHADTAEEAWRKCAGLYTA